MIMIAMVSSHKLYFFFTELCGSNSFHLIFIYIFCQISKCLFAFVANSQNFIILPFLSLRFFISLICFLDGVSFTSIPQPNYGSEIGLSRELHNRDIHNWVMELKLIQMRFSYVKWGLSGNLSMKNCKARKVKSSNKIPFNGIEFKSQYSMCWIKFQLCHKF